ELEALSRANMRPQNRLNLMEAVKEEKVAFETKGRIPWSAPMRAAVLEYTQAVKANRQALAQSFDQAIDFFTKRLDVEKAKEYLAEKDKTCQPKVVAVWNYTAWQAKAHRWEFLYDGTIGGGRAIWWVGKDWVKMKGPDGRFRGGYWIDTCKTSTDGKTMSGTNQVGHRKSAKLVGVE